MLQNFPERIIGLPRFSKPVTYCTDEDYDLANIDSMLAYSDIFPIKISIADRAFGSVLVQYLADRRLDSLLSEIRVFKFEQEAGYDSIIDQYILPEDSPRDLKLRLLHWNLSFSPLLLDLIEGSSSSELLTHVTVHAFTTILGAINIVIAI